MQKTRRSFIENISVGNIVAFTILEKNTNKMLSGRIISLPSAESELFTIRTKNGSIFFVEEKNITWVKTGTRWPLGIYNALKYYKEEKKSEREVDPRNIDEPNGEHQ